jgi:6-phosphogluconolactonase
MMRWKNILTVTVMTLSAGLAQADLVYVGTQGKQLNAMRFDPSDGKLAMIGPVAEGLRPTWTVAHPQLPVLYAVNDENTKEGSVTAFAVNRATGALARVNEVATGGNGTTYLWFDASSSTLLAANFAGGSASSIAVNHDGSVGLLVSTIKATGSGPHRRQASPHAHSVAIDPSGRYALVPDLGADRMFVYGFDRATRALSPDDAAAPRSFVAPAGSGPRHLAFGTNGRYVYLLNELTAEIVTLRWDAQQGRLTQVQTLQTSSPEFAGTKSGAEIAVSGDGRFVYAEDRGEGTLLVYSVHGEMGELTLVQRTSSGGETPWSFAIHPSGKWLLVAHQRSGKVNVFSIDPASGKVTDTGQSVDTPTPVSLTFVK